VLDLEDWKARGASRPPRATVTWDDDGRQR
jgi:hypothetical protein